MDQIGTENADNTSSEEGKENGEETKESRSQGPRKCPKCRNHQVDNLWKGHKRYCRWKSCPCVRCRLVDKRRGITKLQVRLYREQKQDSDKPRTQDDMQSATIPAPSLLPINDQESLEEVVDCVMRQCPTSAPVLYATILKSCHYDLDLAASTIAQARTYQCPAPDTSALSGYAENQSPLKRFYQQVATPTYLNYAPGFI